MGNLFSSSKKTTENLEEYEEVGNYIDPRRFIHIIKDDNCLLKIKFKDNQTALKFTHSLLLQFNKELTDNKTLQLCIDKNYDIKIDNNTLEIKSNETTCTDESKFIKDGICKKLFGESFESGNKYINKKFFDEFPTYNVTIINIEELYEEIKKRQNLNKSGGFSSNINLYENYIKNKNNFLNLKRFI